MEKGNSTRPEKTTQDSMVELSGYVMYAFNGALTQSDLRFGFPQVVINLTCN